MKHELSIFATVRQFQTLRLLGFDIFSRPYVYLQPYVYQRQKSNERIFFHVKQIFLKNISQVAPIKLFHTAYHIFGHVSKVAWQFRSLLLSIVDVFHAHRSQRKSQKYLNFSLLPQRKERGLQHAENDLNFLQYNDFHSALKTFLKILLQTEKYFYEMLNLHLTTKNAMKKVFVSLK